MNSLVLCALPSISIPPLSVNLRGVRKCFDQTFHPTSISQTEKSLGHLPICKRLGHCIHWWEKHSHPQVLKLVKEEISLPNLPPMLFQHHQKHGQKEINLAKEILEDYFQSGAVERVGRKKQNI